MFNKLKQFKDLRSQAKTLEAALAAETVTVERSGVQVTMNGNSQVTNLVLPTDRSTDELARIIPTVINDGTEKVKRIMAEKMKAMGGLDWLKQQ